MSPGFDEDAVRDSTSMSRLRDVAEGAAVLVVTPFVLWASLRYAIDDGFADSWLGQFFWGLLKQFFVDFLHVNLNPSRGYAYYFLSLLTGANVVTASYAIYFYATKADPPIVRILFPVIAVFAYVFAKSDFVMSQLIVSAMDGLVEEERYTNRVYAENFVFSVLCLLYFAAVDYFLATRSNTDSSKVALLRMSAIYVQLTAIIVVVFCFMLQVEVYSHNWPSDDALLGFCAGATVTILLFSNFILAIASMTEFPRLLFSRRRP